MSQATLPLVKLHVEHIVPYKHSGTDDLSNLVLACFHCNLGKSSNLSGIDPVSEQIVVLFNPRTQAWSDRFRFVGAETFGLTATGRATVQVLNMNEPDWLEFRREVLRNGQSW